MRTDKRTTISIISLLVMLIAITTVFCVAFTLAGNPETPDAVATYTTNKLDWDVPSDENGIVQLNFFGDPEPGEEYPVIDPFSKDKYYLRIKNDETDGIGYSIFFYTDNTNKIPIKFDITKTDEMKDVIATPIALEDKQIISSYAGGVSRRSVKDFEINWYWDTESDEKDTAIGDSAVLEDQLFTINVMIVIEDHTTHSGGIGSIYSGGQSQATLLHRSYVIGYPEGDFRPENSIARSEVAAIFSRIQANYDESVLVDTKTGFSDVKANDWHAKYIASLEDTKIITGYEDGTFRPESPITRAEFATVCVRYFESRTDSIKNATSDFTDVNNTHWASEYIEKAVKEAFVNGYPDGTFKPDQNITRAEVVTVMNRLLARYPDKEFIDGNLDILVSFTDLKDNRYWAYYDIYEAANIHHAKVNDKNESWFGTK